jgi:hypothetical protein
MPVAAAQIAYKELFALLIGYGLAGLFREFRLVMEISRPRS